VVSRTSARMDSLRRKRRILVSGKLILQIVPPGSSCKKRAVSRQPSAVSGQKSAVSLSTVNSCTLVPPLQIAKYGGSRGIHPPENGCSCFVTGHDFSRAITAIKLTRASAPAACFPPISPRRLCFSATCLGPEQRDPAQIHPPLCRWLIPQVRRQTN